MGAKSKIIRIKENWKNIKTKQFWEDILIYYLAKIVYPRNNGIFIVEEDWDNLIILDACRFDMFKEEFERRNIRGTLTYKISRGSGTPEFLIENFGNGQFYDIVYITANPYVDLLLKGRFYKIISVWKDGWNEEYNTVLPSTMYEYVLDALVRYPDKRFIIHFMQPHYPFITLKIKGDTGIKYQRKAILEEKSVWQDVTVWSLLKAGVVSFEDLIKGYKENLSLALDYVEKLIDVLPGTTVITADHGEAFGEKLHPLIPIRVYGHYNGVRIESLIKVPWLVVNEKEKKLKKPEKLKIKQAIKNYMNKKLLSDYDGSKKTQISVIMCVKNREQEIERALKSVKNQKGVLEVIVVDGDSTDRTVEIAKKYTNKIYSDKGKGLAYARQLGAEKARGMYIAYVDSDTELPREDLLINMVNEMERNGWVAIHAQLIDPRKEKTLWEYCEDIHWQRRFNSPGERRYLGTIVCVVKRDIILKYRFDSFMKYAAEDTEFWNRVGKEHKFGVSKEIAFHYHRASFKDFIKQRIWYGKGNARAMVKHKAWKLLLVPFGIMIYGVFQAFKCRKCVKCIPYYLVWGIALMYGTILGLLDIWRER